MEKKEFLLRQIRKTNKKDHENYAVTRIIHRVDDADIKFVTQQHVTRPEKGRALTDLFLPQLALHVEIDEEHHKAAAQVDDLREADIVNATGHMVLRIDATTPLEELNAQIDKVVSTIQIELKEKRAIGSFIPWDPRKEHDPVTYITMGYMDAKDDVAFKRQAEACNCFGHNYKQWYRALARNPSEPDVCIWFPKLYENADWQNSISDDEETIYERKRRDNEAFIVEHLARPEDYKRLVFPRVRGPLGDVMYRFKGRYEVDVNESQRTSTIVYRRTAKREKTYPQRGKLS